MFISTIENFRAKGNDVILTLNEDALLDGSYQICCDFLDVAANDDNEEVHALEDYITYGFNDSGYVHKRLLTLLASLCNRYINSTIPIMNNKSYCNSTISSFEHPESHWL